jgi:hypothetical protein
MTKKNKKQNKVLYVTDMEIKGVPNYMEACLKQGEKMLEKPPGLYIVDIEHDDWCEIWKGGICNCNPIVKEGKEWTKQK